MDEMVASLVDVCAVSELPPGQSKIVNVGSKSLGVFNVNGTFYALANLCPHAGGPLCRGQVTGTVSAEEPYVVSWHRSGEIVRCPWHSWEFDIATGTTLTDPRRTVTTFRTEVRNGRVYVAAGSAR